MKKVLLVLGVAATLGLVACDPKSDCECTTTYGDVVSDGVVATITEFEGECDEITSSTAGLTWASGYEDFANDKDVVMSCKEK